LHFLKIFCSDEKRAAGAAGTELYCNAERPKEQEKRTIVYK
jgi:hypothetical protein